MPIDIYPKSRTERPDWELFARPSAEYRGAPFWSWNNRLDRGQLLRQIDQLRAMGFGGFHMHPRTGLDTPYLGDDFMGHVRACVEKAHAESMLAWLYDEDRWPSGFAGGLVTKDERYRARHLLFTPRPYSGAAGEATNISNSWGSRAENGTLLARFEVVLEDGGLARYRRLADGEEPAGAGRAWYAYLETATPVSWYNNQTYVDTLSPDAIRRFVEVTHERYAACIGGEFGRTVPAIFTDEPQFTHKRSLRRPEDTDDLFLPWTDDLPDTYREAYGQELLDHLPEIFWELPEGKASVARYRYHDHVAERFSHAFADTVGAWCGAHGLALTGHMMEEPTLGSQTAALGEAMRSYRAFHIPGIDMLCDSREYTTARQAQSAARQYGRPGVMSELYGVTNWDFPFSGHKAQGDWQAAMGVTVRVPHLAWVSMAGEAKRDYPASIGYQSPWYREYPLVEDHFARVNTVLTRGKPIVRVGVIHPVESYWLCFGPLEQTAMEREERETAFRNVTEWLLFGLVDFDFISESLLPSQNPRQEGDRFQVGEMAYEAVVVPGMRTIRASTLARLEAFAEAGGTVIFAGEVPSLVDAEPSERAQTLAARCQTVPLTRPRLLAALSPYRDLSATLAHGAPADALIYQMRADGNARALFLVNTDKAWGRRDVRIRLFGEYAPTHLDTFTGERTPMAARYEDGQTLLTWTFPAHGHLLLWLEPGRSTVEETPAPAWREIGRLADPVPVTLSEPNVLLLDQAEYRIDGGDWHGPEELLRLENAVRAHFGLAKKTGSIAQPWTDTEPAPPLGTLELRFLFQSEVEVSGARLAVEDPQTLAITLDGRPVRTDVKTGWWVDECIRTLDLPAFGPGAHELVVSMPFTRKTNVEWRYILGDFGVRVAGSHTVITAPVRALAWGDWTRQGLPFYAGNVTYHARLDGTDAPVALRVPRFSAPLLSVERDGGPAGKVAFAPYRVVLGALPEGEHRLDITAYGNRFNAFGCLHNTHPVIRWAGPDAWRSAGEDWADEYQLRLMGILAAPLIESSAD